ncbi:hypothetical protein SAMN05661008_00244 [Alkalithermobacter thermoalcaliphilus JW-YL-7 = DSM 7308]|uniref:Uncharacterized protein n=1 Tax=Alkalithermobacter thermoalcaliphilus JW-YL-7 = DSM 7308 TaxID=1121328 RepID=A0A150FRG9_CLOPD|nr:hypothetical protein JWYL7_1278 [[Clostridium] paradoxum JW-YL-7 = DSM 7308]SHK42743.1 hypothetical protein SAMN05661008_00244 [[Clostridium] paradoxum JW-YL-7 = DSM 7308]
MNEEKYIVNKDESTYLFYIDDKNLHMQIIKEEQKLENYIIEQNVECFCADINEDTIHIICINSYGNLIHLQYLDSGTKKDVLTVLDIQHNKFNGIKMCIDNFNIDIFIVVLNIKANNYNLIHYSINNIDLEKYKLGEVVYDEYSSYKIDIDSKNNIHLIYRAYNNSKIQLYYRMFNKVYKRWLVPEKISDRNLDTTNINILCDSNNYVHLFWTTTTTLNYVYKKVDDSLISNWNRHLDFKQMYDGVYNTMLIQVGNDIRLFWTHHKTLYCAQTEIGKNYGKI